MPIEHKEVPEYPDDEHEFHVVQDQEENHETMPPDGEVIGHPAIMMAECYIGGDLDGLTSGLRALDLDQQHAYEPDNYFAWTDAVRRTSNSGGLDSRGQFLSKRH